MEMTQATLQDLQELTELYHRVTDHMEEIGSRQWHWGDYPTEELLRGDVERGATWIYREDGKVIAAVAILDEQDKLYEQVPWSFGIRPAVVHRLVVAPEWQGRGVGSNLMDDVLDHLRRQGFDSVRIDTLSESPAAMRLYETKLGFRRSGTVRWHEDDRQFICFEKSLRRETPLLPIRMNPAFRGGKLTPWGGQKLKNKYGKPILEVPTGESLEVSCIPGLESRDDLGRTLPELIAEWGEKLIGNYTGKPFPLLLKLIDAREALSVQVHPNDEYAARKENGKLGKTEAWLILDAPEDGELVYGILPGTTMKELSAACEKGAAVEPLLRRVKVRPGDVCYIPAGCVHAIGAGITLYEIQQSSDITYRFYDWDRTDAQGKRRELHLKKALDVTDLALEPRPLHTGTGLGLRRVLNEEYFTLDLIRTVDGEELPPPRNFGFLTGLEGELTLRWHGGKMPLKPGETVFLANQFPDLVLEGVGVAALSMPA